MLRDLNARELLVFAPLLAAAIWIGIYPKPLFDVLDKPVNQIVERVQAARPLQASSVAR